MIDRPKFFSGEGWRVGLALTGIGFPVGDNSPCQKYGGFEEAEHDD